MALQEETSFFPHVLPGSSRLGEGSVAEEIDLEEHKGPEMLAKPTAQNHKMQLLPWQICVKTLDFYQ